ncbi:hypothetical protein [Pseudomonas sp. 3HC3]|uniref:hypothetical protein n=1 Tax=Pseudomonas sp. 3HC3 TaxID=2781025 RepID=UPI003846849F
MILQSLDLDALQGAVLWSTNRRLSDFLLETLNGSLPRFHTRGEDVPPFVAKAGALVSKNGYTCGKEYSLLVLSHLLLGLGWWADPRANRCGQSDKHLASPRMSNLTC